MKLLKPMNNMVLIEYEDPKTTKGGLHLPDKHQQDDIVEGVVVAVGPGAVDSYGEPVAIPLSPGDSVIFTRPHAFLLTIDNKPYYCIDALKILVHRSTNGSQTETDQASQAASPGV